MFVILDTNHYRELIHETQVGHVLAQRMAESESDAFTTVVTAQEITQGWNAELNRLKAGREQVRAYGAFLTRIESFRTNLYPTI